MEFEEIIENFKLQKNTVNMRILSETAEYLNPSFDGTKESAEDVVYDLFKVPQKDEASIGRLLSVLKSMGLTEDDPRLSGTINKV